MQSGLVSSLTRKIDMLDVIRISAVLSFIFMVITFFAACAEKREQADSSSILREGPSGHEVHGEVGAMYGQGISRR